MRSRAATTSFREVLAKLLELIAGGAPRPALVPVRARAR